MQNTPDELQNAETLTDEELAFLQAAVVDSPGRIGEPRVKRGRKQPKFPKKTLIVLGTVFTLMFVSMVSLLSSFHKYSIFMEKQDIQALVYSKYGRSLGLPAVSYAAQLYNTRFVYYAVLLVIALIVLGAIALFWWVRNRAWQRMDE